MRVLQKNTPEVRGFNGHAPLTWRTEGYGVAYVARRRLQSRDAAVRLVSGHLRHATLQSAGTATATTLEHLPVTFPGARPTL